jgi:hypothetical protein
VYQHGQKSCRTWCGSMRTDPYLPQILALLRHKALEVIHEEDRELFARALESRLRD